jgi:hypothetical protein
MAKVAKMWKCWTKMDAEWMPFFFAIWVKKCKNISPEINQN